MNVRELLTTEIEGQIELMRELEFGTEKYQIAAEGLAKLLDKLNEMDRIDIDYQDKSENRELGKQELALKTKQIEDERKDRNIKNGLTAASVIGGFVLTIWGTLKTLKFEETGTVTTNAGRAFINKLFPKK